MERDDCLWFEPIVSRVKDKPLSHIVVNFYSLHKHEFNKIEKWKSNSE